MFIWNSISHQTGGRQMKLSPNKCIRPLILALIFSLTPILFWSCANVQHQATFNKNYLPKEDVRIKVAKVVNDTGYSFDVDIEQLLANTLEEQLMEENLLNLGKTEPNLFMESRIIGYKKGSALKRWVMPGWGATELAIRCDLRDDKNNLVGTAMASREVVAGGLYTVGAWETIFNDVANDVAGDLKDQIVAQGYVVKPKTQPQATTAAKDIEPSAQATDQSQETPKLASIPKDTPVVRVRLRRQPILITNQMQITNMLVEYDFFDRSRNPRGSFVNSFIDNNDGTIIDKATGLMWQKSGSTSRLNNRRAKEYIKQLNRKRFAGYGDWRMPTVEELASILVRKRKNGAHIDPVFEGKQTLVWTIDRCESQSWSWLNGAWLVDFKNGEVNEAYWQGETPIQYTKNTENHVKAVRLVR
jgi:serine/threonine-protein kinase